MDHGASEHKSVPCNTVESNRNESTKDSFLEPSCIKSKPSTVVTDEDENYQNAESKDLLVEFKRGEICDSEKRTADDDSKHPKLETAFELQPVENFKENASLKNGERISDQKINNGNNDSVTQYPCERPEKKLSESTNNETYAFRYYGEGKITHDYKELSESQRHLKSKYNVTEDDTVCGIGFFKPQWIQKYATPKVYLTLYCIVGVISGSYYTYLSGIMSTIEKRFALSSQMSSSIYMVKEISPFLLGIPIGYFGGRYHKPRIIAFGMFLTIMSCFITVLPYFIYGPAKDVGTLATNNATGPEVCDGRDKLQKCEKDDRPPTLAPLLMLLIGSCIDGFGGMAYFACGISYMDDNAKKKNTPVYIGIAYACRLFRPIFGYLMCSAFLKLNEDPFVDPGYGPDDPRWIGGWWMGFVLEALLLTVFTIPLAMFPRRLPSYAVPSNALDSQASFRDVIAELIPTVKRLMKNPIFVLLTIHTTVNIIGNGGYFVMLPKYAENQFRLTASDASLLAGPAGLAAIQLATVSGSIIIWKYKPGGKFLIGGIAVSEVISAVGYLILLIPRCETVNLHNVGENADGLILWNECNVNCSCTTADFTPFCGPDGKTTYFSPCHAGCTQLENHNDSQVYHNCSCFINSENPVAAHSVEKGFCIDKNCWSQALAFLIILPTFHFITSFLRVGHTIVQLRSISPKDKSAGLGLFESLISLFGFIPYPIIFGALVDSVCLVWQKSCGERGNCWFYDMDKFNLVMHGLAATFSVLAAFSMLGIYFLSNRLPDLYEEEIEEDDVPKTK